MKPINVPPDASLIALARIINGKLAGASVNFYLIQHADQRNETGVVFQCGVRRAVVKTQAILGEGDADEIVQSVNDWANKVQPESKWTTDPREAA